MSPLKRKIIAFFTFIGGFYFFLEFVLPKKIGEFQFGLYHEQISKGIQVVGVMAIGLGVWNIVRVHGGSILYLRGRWWNSVALLMAFAVTLCFEIGELTLNQRIAALRNRDAALSKQVEERCAESPEGCSAAVSNMIASLSAPDRVAAPEYTKLTEQLKGQLLEGTPSKEVTQQLSAEFHGAVAKSFEQLDAEREGSRWAKGQEMIREALFVPLGSAMFALLAFYIANAAYRSFRVRSVEASILMGAAFIVMLGQIPHGPLYISEELPSIRLWLLRYINTPAFRAIYFGSAIAGLAMAIRMWLSLERSPMEEGSHES